MREFGWKTSVDDDRRSLAGARDAECRVIRRDGFVVVHARAGSDVGGY